MKTLLSILLLLIFFTTTATGVNDTIEFAPGKPISAFSLSIKFNPGKSVDEGRAIELLKFNICDSALLIIKKSSSSYGNFEPTPFIEFLLSDISGNQLSKGIIYEERGVSIFGKENELVVWGNPENGIQARLNSRQTSAGIEWINDDDWHIQLIPNDQISFQTPIFESMESLSKTAYDVEDLLTIAQSNVLPSGIYTYLDRDNDERLARVGGLYKLAIIPDESNKNFKIFYLEGAIVGSERWKPGMLKGVLEQTRFKNHYNLVWFDAEGVEMNNEISAGISENGILELNFPLYKTTLRFSRIHN